MTSKVQAALSSSCLNMLRFTSPQLEEQFQHHFARSQTRATLTWNVFNVAMWLLACVKVKQAAPYSWYCVCLTGSLLLLAPTWLIRSNYPFWLRNRSALLLVIRVVQQLWAVLFQDYMYEGSAVQELPSLLHLLLRSKTLMLFSNGFGYQLLWPLHLFAQSAAWLLLLATNARSCAALGPAPKTAAHIGALAAAAFGGGGGAAGLLPSMRYDAANACQLLLGGMQTLIGFLVPTWLLFAMEVSVRRRFLESRNLPAPAPRHRRLLFTLALLPLGVFLFRVLEVYDIALSIKAGRFFRPHCWRGVCAEPVPA